MQVRQIAKIQQRQTLHTHVVSPCDVWPVHVARYFVLLLTGVCLGPFLPMPMPSRFRHFAWPHCPLYDCLQGSSYQSLSAHNSILYRSVGLMLPTRNFSTARVGPVGHYDPRLSLVVRKVRAGWETVLGQSTSARRGFGMVRRKRTVFASLKCLMRVSRVNVTAAEFFGQIRHD
jgi:hypothetical protein